ncbi:MAG: hypothetical protein Q9174_004569 [Haloplaca sp. 1 TL-2023]
MPFHFLELPAELREIILRLLLIHETPIIAHACYHLKPPGKVLLGLTPAICRVSRAVHAEAIAILYSKNVFQAHPTFLATWPFAMDHQRPVLSGQCASQIKRWHVRIRVDVDPFYQAADVVRTFTGMDEVEIEVFRASWAIGTYEALEGFIKIRGVRRAKVHGSLGKKYARWLEGVMMSPVGAEIVELDPQSLDSQDR